MKTHLLSLFTFSLLSLPGLAQTQSMKCSHPNPSPEALHNMHTLRSSAKSTDTKIIPVVFHVLHQYGSENITDAQIFDQMITLNEDFQRLNDDTTFVLPPFDTIIGKANFEFRLAAIDPNGNPTTGIERIATPLTNVGDASAMINMWDPMKYVNIWVVNTSLPGLSGFSTNPLANENPCVQGIMMLNDYIGSIGTGSWAIKHSLTHEMGHYFGLFHTWGNGDFSGTCAFSDGIIDTPLTQGNSSCNQNANSCNDANNPQGYFYWGFDVRDNVENFMDNSYCPRMFTNDQAEMMRTVAESPDYGRNILWTEENLIATGTGPGPQLVSEALPLSDFSVNRPMNCVSDSVTMINANGLQAGTTYSWSFPGGSPASSSLQSPKVAYDNPGTYTISLTATNSNGSTTTTKNGAVIISGNWAEYTGPHLFDFEAIPFWIARDENYDNATFEQIPNSGVSNSACFKLENHFEIDSLALCSFIFEDKLIGRDALITPAFNLSNTTNVTVSYDLAYATAATDPLEYLRVYSSIDCGETWTQRQVVQDDDLVSAVVPADSNYIPEANDWSHHTFTYITSAATTKTRFMFGFAASNKSNNLYIDNFEINGILGISDNQSSNIAVFPNPAKQGTTISVSGLKAENAAVTIFDIQGKKVFETELKNSSADETIELDHSLSSGCYMIEVSQTGNQFRTRLIVE
jgi:PKD repeat protein